jgi:hypothetical protein
MKNRYFSGIPTTETDIRAFETAIASRPVDSATGQFAAAAHVEAQLETVTRRSMSLVQANTLLAILTLLLMSRPAEQAMAAYLQYNRWAFIFALVSALVLVTNLGLVWARDPRKAYGDPHTAFEFAFNVYKRRAWRYSLGLLLSFAAFALTLFSLTQMR